MAELTTLARPYAKAAFEFARDQKDLASWSSALSLMAALTNENNIVKVLASPTLTPEQKSAMFVEVCGDKLNPTQQNFVRVLAENKRLSLSKEISELYELYKANQEKTVEVEVQSAFAIDDAIAEKLKNILSKKLDREVHLHTSINKALIGGALVRAGDTVIDSSVKGRLAKLAEAMGV